MIQRFKVLGHLTLDIAWAAVILFLPITSLPLLSRLVGNTMVAPASFIPLVWLVLFWFISYIFSGGSIPRESIPFFFFISIAFIISAFTFFGDIPPFKDKNILGEEIRGILSLAIGAAFYLVTASWLARSRSKLTSTLKWINISGIILLLWATIQAVYIYLFQGKFPAILMDFQRLISTRDLFETRITAFAFEPSWVAQQLNLMYLPFWFAATINRWSTFHFRLWKLSLENILLGIGVVVLFLSSRVGTLSLLLIIAFMLIYLNFHLARWLQLWSLARFVRFPPFFQKSMRSLLPIMILFTFLAIYFVGALALVYGLSHVDSRLAVIFQIKSLIQLKSLTSNIYLLFNYLQFAERYVYWVAGWSIFNVHPILGVGLGNAGFYFQNALPAYSWHLPEVMQVYFREASLPNIKSLWVRLLAEMGIVGFSSFLAWCYVMVKTAWSMRVNTHLPFKVIGWVGIFVLIAFITEGFSTDTFALPYLWISLGMVSAAGAILRNT